MTNHLKRCALIPLLAMSCLGGQSVALKSGFQASGTLPSTYDLSSVRDCRFEFRLHTFSQPVDYNGWILILGGIYVRFYQGSNIINVTDVPDTPGYTITNIDSTGRNDVIVRFQRDFVNKQLSMELWNPDGTNYAFVTAPLTSASAFDWRAQTVSFGSPTTATDLAYMRVYSSVLPLNSPPPSKTNGDILDYEFEGNLTDKSTHTTNLLVTSGAVPYELTPLTPIHITFGQFGSQRVWSANRGSLSLDSSSTYSSVDDPTYSYTWSQVNGPALGSFSASTSAKTAFTSSVPGDYLVRLTVSDGVQTGHLDVDFGAVNTDVNDVVQTGFPDMDQSLGPLTMWGTSPWPWFDSTEMANADALYSLFTTPPLYGQTALSGTITPDTLGGRSITGTGTHFTTDLVGCRPAGGSQAYACSDSSVTAISDLLTYQNRFFRPDINCAAGATLSISGTTALPISNPTCLAGKIYRLSYDPGTEYSPARPASIGLSNDQPLIWCWWNSPDGTGTGRLLTAVISIVDDTHIIVDSNWIIPLASSTHMQYSQPSATELGVYWGYLGQPSNTLGYYDTIHALYKLYYRTGLTKYQTEARTFADLWFKYASGQGYFIGAPRAMNYMGLIDRAIDGHPTIWAAVDAYLTYPWAVTAYFSNTTPNPPGTAFDPREMGFATRYVARAATLFQNNDGTANAGKRASYCTALHNVVVNLAASAQDNLGQWQEDLYGVNIGYAAARLNGSFGSAPWRHSNLGIGNMDANAAATTCGDAAAATAALSVVTKFGDFLHDYGRGKVGSSGRPGQWGTVMYGSRYYTGLIHAYAANGNISVAPYTTGTLSVVTGSTAVVGVGTNFTTFFPATHQYIGIPAQKTNGSSCNETIQVASVTDDTHLTLSVPWRCASASGIDGAGYGWIANQATSTNCPGSTGIGMTCEGDAPDSDLSHDVHAIWAWLYWKTGAAKYLAWAQESLGTDYGGPSGGPGTPTSPRGPYSTGVAGNFGAALPPCSGVGSAPAPCGGAGPQNGLGKSYGFSAGAGNANNAFAYLVMGTPTTSITKSIYGKVKIGGTVH